jgi:hypothetical protein
MLVHVTRFIPVQKLVLDQVSTELKDIVNRLRYGDGNSTKQLLTELQELWNKDIPAATTAAWNERTIPRSFQRAGRT